MRILKHKGKEFRAKCVGDLILKEGYDKHYFTPDYTIYKISNIGEVILVTASPTENSVGTILQQRLKRLNIRS